MKKLGKFDFGVFGGGVVGGASAFVGMAYSSFRSGILCEKYDRLAPLNSAIDQSAQTLHFGDIESNMSIEESIKVLDAATLTANYGKMVRGNFFEIRPKMLLAVGKKEMADLERRYGKIRHLYPGLRFIGYDEIAKLEPKVTEGREHKNISALRSEDGRIMNYEGLTASLIENAGRTGKKFEVSLGTKVESFHRTDFGYEVVTNKGVVEVRFAIITAGAHSLLLARSLGYGSNLTLLPIAGSFYLSHRVLNNKVYTMQDPDIPFAAPHGDPPFHNNDETRFGPTAKFIPFLERRNGKTFIDFLIVAPHTPSELAALFRAVSTRINEHGNKEFTFKRLAYMFRNMFYDLPIVGKGLYLQQVQKIIPTMHYRDLRYGKGIGGLRPQIVNLKTGEIVFGISQICGENNDPIIFNITPSPGATAALQTGMLNIQKAVAVAGEKFDQEKFDRDLRHPIYQTTAP